MTTEGTIDTEVEIDRMRQKRVDPDGALKGDLATRFVDPECPFSGPIGTREHERAPTAYAVAGRREA